MLTEYLIKKKQKPCFVYCSRVSIFKCTDHEETNFVSLPKLDYVLLRVLFESRCGVYSRTVFNQINMVIIIFTAQAITELFWQ